MIAFLCLHFFDDFDNFPGQIQIFFKESILKYSLCNTSIYDKIYNLCLLISKFHLFI